MFMKTINNHLFRKIFRYYSTIKPKSNKLPRVNAWQIHSYGELEELQLTRVREPIIDEPDQVLINVEAVSVNPIDLYMIGGYGRTLMQLPRCNQMELPLTVGRDFAGTVLSKGHNVRKSLKIGDKVYGFLPVHKPGSFAEIIVAKQSHIKHCPPDLNATESASLVYATMTAWSALYLFGNLCQVKPTALKILILGASGGVGCSAVQLLKSQNFTVHATCATDAVNLVQSLGADQIFDYKTDSFFIDIASQGHYHLILDCAKFGCDNIPRAWNYGTYITLNSPLLLNTDKHGLFNGLALSARELVTLNVTRCSQGKRVRWAFFVPSSEGFAFIHSLISQGKIRPTIHKQFNFNAIPEALKFASNGHLRGKIVINF